MYSLKYQPNTIHFNIITSHKYFLYFTKLTIFNKIHYFLKYISKIEDGNTPSLFDYKFLNLYLMNHGLVLINVVKIPTRMKIVGPTTANEPWGM